MLEALRVGDLLRVRPGERVLELGFGTGNEVIDLAAAVSAIGNLNVISDAGVGVLAAYAALRSAALNVYTNVKMIADKAFAEAKVKELEMLLSGAEGVTEKAYELVKGKLS